MPLFSLADARLKLASRLNLPVEFLGALVRREAVPRATWEQLFPAEVPPVKLNSDTKPAAAAVAEGFVLDDIRFAFYGRMSIQSGLISRFMEDETAIVVDKIATLQPLVPYLNL